ncbi:MAG TPA: undecaprenyl-diphosphate phosphatase [Candidatus Paceibacterota bacterium]|nr:undecaprenyl-diphosphate phosphatase [Candidatus Paceibacterota bacterium]
MTTLDTMILGAIEGFTEFLPISSTGHLILAAELLGLPSTEFLKSFQIAVQLGAIAAVLLLYFRTFLDIELLKRLFVAFLPTGLVGFLVYPYVKEFLLGNSLVVVISLFVGGVALIVFELLHKERWEHEIDLRDITYKQAAFVGIFQSIAIIPGVSRSAATIVGGLLAGLPRVSIVEFSFLLAVPTMVAATGYDLLKSAHQFTKSDAELMAIGFIVSMLVAFASMKFLLGIVRRYSFIPFGIYRIVIAVLFFVVVIL